MSSVLRRIRKAMPGYKSRSELEADKRRAREREKLTRELRRARQENKSSEAYRLERELQRYGGPLPSPAEEAP